MKRKILIVTACTAAMLFGGCSADALKLQKEEFTVEYGEKIKIDAAEYLDTKDKDILNNAEVKVDADNEKEKDYPAVGEYTVAVTYKKKEKDFKVLVKDTKAPEFIDFKKEITIEKDAEKVDLADYFSTKDLSGDVQLMINGGTYDAAKEGTYEIEVAAMDKYDNKTTEKASVKVVSMEAAEKDGVTAKVDGSKPTSKALKDKKAEEEAAKQKEEEQQKTAQNQAQPSAPQKKQESSGGTANGSGNNGGAPSAPSNGGSSNSGGNGGASTPPPAQNVCVADGTFGRVGNSGKVFFSKQEADQWAQSEWLNENSPNFMHGYTSWTVTDSCGEERNDVWTINWYATQQ